MTRLLALVLGLLPILCAQSTPTRIVNLQLQGTVASAPQVRLTLATGDVVDADIDLATLEVVTQPSGKPLLRAIITGSSTRVYGRVAAVDTGDSTGRTFRLPVPTTNLVVFRNGVRQRLGWDYVTVDPQTIFFDTYYTGQGGASIEADYDPI